MRRRSLEPSPLSPRGQWDLLQSLVHLRLSLCNADGFIEGEKRPGPTSQHRTHLVPERLTVPCVKVELSFEFSHPRTV
jgi:hypothetical protein